MPGWVKGYFELGAEKQGKFVEELSAKQQQRTNETIMEAVEDDADAVASSDVFRAFEADLKLFGGNAFQKPVREDEPPK